MFRIRVLLLALFCTALLTGLASAQGFNWGGTCALSWNRDATVPSITNACGLQRLYVRLNDIKEVKGAEFGLSWTPHEAVAGFTFGDASFKTAAYGTCGWLARDTVVTITVEPDTSGFRYTVASAWSGLELACTSGAVAQMNINFESGCVAAPVHFTLTYCKVIDHNGRINDMAITGGATIDLLPTAQEPSSWGAIKALYR